MILHHEPKLFSKLQFVEENSTRDADKYRAPCGCRKEFARVPNYFLFMGDRKYCQYWVCASHTQQAAIADARGEVAWYDVGVVGDDAE